MASVDAALMIISNVNATADSVCVNKNQCRRLAQRFDGIRKALTVLKADDDGEIFFGQILAVLKKGEALVLSYADEKSALQNALSRADNCEAFREVHEEIDGLGACLDLDHVSKSELDSDAVADRVEMPPKLHNVIVKDVSELSSGSIAERAEAKEQNVENMEMAVTQKCDKTESKKEDLSYLDIPFAAIFLKGAIKELKPLSQRPTQADAHLDGKALVEKGTWNGCDCAIKVFKSADIHWNTGELDKEIESLVKLRHPHITQLIGCARQDDKTYVLYEMMDSDLRALMDSRKKKRIVPKLFQFDDRPFSRAEEVSIITQIARGMFYLHEKGLVHGELKCTNLLVKEVGGHIDIKVADFHCSRQLGQAPTSKYLPAHRARWMPPEDFKYCGVGEAEVDQPTDDLLMKGDVYSFAMTCYEVVTGKYPFDGFKGKVLDEKIKVGERPDLPKDLSKDLQNLIEKCWHGDPTERPNFQQICHVLSVDAVNLTSQVEKLLCCFGLGSVAPSADILEGKKWTDIFPEVRDDSVKMRSIQGIDDAAKDLPHYLKIDPLDLHPMRPLGSGASAEVFEASWVGCRFAVKWLKVQHVSKLRQEVSIMMKHLHPHVIRLVGFSVLGNRCAIVMESMETSLRDLMDHPIKSSKEKHLAPFSESEALGIITKLALGMKFLHSRDVTHGDLKCANVLARNANSKGTKLEVKIVDFGLSQLPGESAAVKPSVVGWWRAPEVIENMESKTPGPIDSKAADVYSFAMTCYEVITSKKPFQGVSFAHTLAKAGGGPNLDKLSVREDVKRLLKHCWELNPQRRPTFETICQRLSRMC